MDQYRCPNCDEYRRTITGHHGMVVHLFMQHKMCGDEIQKLLLDPEANGYHKRIVALGTGALGPDWWDDALKEEPE